MRIKITGAVAALLSLTAVLVDFGTDWYVNRLAEDGAISGWLPQFETVGQTVIVYLYASVAVTFGLTILGVAALGYWAGMKLDVTHEYRPLVGSLAIGGGTGYLTALLILGLNVGGSLSSLGSDAVLLLAMLLGGTVATGIEFALVGLAGAALAEFEFAPFSGRKTADSSDSTVQFDTE